MRTVTNMATTDTQICILTFLFLSVPRCASHPNTMLLQNHMENDHEDPDLKYSSDDDNILDFKAEHEIDDVMHIQPYISPSELTDQWVNHHKFSYVVDAKDKCKGDVFVLALIKTEPEKFVERQDIRDTWGAVGSYKGASVVPIFITGMIKPDKIMRQIEDELLKESAKNGDIVQGDFIDHFKNQTYKTVMGLAWAAEFCSRAKFVLITNDNTMVDMYHLIDFLQEKTKAGKNKNLLYCSAFVDIGPVRDPSEKLYVNIKDYPYKIFPTHCEGFAYVLSADVHKKLLEASKGVPFLWLDDVYVTGLLADKAGVQHTDMTDDHTYNWMQDEHLKSDIRSSMFLLAPYTELRKNWNKAWAAIEKERT